MSTLIFGVVEENLGENIFLPRVAASVRNIPVLAGEGVTLLYSWLWNGPKSFKVVLGLLGVLQFLFSKSDS